MGLRYKAIMGSAIVGSMIAGGAIGIALFGTAAGAQTGSTGSTTTTPTATSSPAPGTGGGTFHSNEDPTHEAGESAAREAQENAGQMPTVP
jgi:hypothetical protein